MTADVEPGGRLWFLAAVAWTVVTQPPLGAARRGGPSARSGRRFGSTLPGADRRIGTESQDHAHSALRRAIPPCASSIEENVRSLQCPVVDASELQRAVAACRAVAAACGLRVDDAVVLHNSNRLVVRLRACDVLGRVAPHTRQNGAKFEVEVARRLAETGAPLATLDPRVGPEEGPRPDDPTGTA